MKQKKPLFICAVVLGSIILSGCSSSDKARFPANHLPNEHTTESELKIYSGPGAMSAEYPVASSLQEIPVEVELSPLPEGVECKSGEVGSYSKNNRFLLSPYSAGGGETVYCRLAHDGADYPRFATVKAKYTIANRTKYLPFQDTNEFKTYDSYLNELESMNPSPGLLQLTEGVMETKTVVMDYENGFDFEIELTGEALEVASFGGNVKFDEGWFSSSESSPEGIEANERKRDTLSDPERPAYELLCTVGDKLVRGSEFEKIFIFDFTGKINCSVNLYHKYARKKHEGSYEVVLNKIPLSKLRDYLESALEEEEFSHKNLIERIWSQDIASLSESVRRVEQNQRGADRLFQERVAQVDRQRFESKRDKVIDNLFPREVKGIIGRGVSVFTFTPAQKKYFLPDGAVKSKTYLALKGSSNALFKSSDFAFDFKYTPFGEDFNVYLYAEDAWNDQLKPIELRVCLSDKKKFYQTLFYLQKKANGQSMTINDYVETLGRFETRDSGLCEIYDGEEFSFSRRDEYYWFGRSEKDSFKVERFGALYEGQFYQEALRHIYVKDGTHPLKGKTFSKDSVEGEEKSGKFVVKRSLDGFVLDP